MTGPPKPAVFCSHASADKPAVSAFAARLRADGIDAWVDGWEIDGGDDLVARINDGLGRATAGLVFFSQHTPTSRWVDAEISALTYRAVQGLRIIPVLLHDDAPVPPLLTHYLRRSIDEYAAIRDAVIGRSRRPALGALPEQSWDEVLVRLEPSGSGPVRIQVWWNAEPLADTLRPLSSLLEPSSASSWSETMLLEVGRACGALLFPDPVAARLAAYATSRRQGDRLDIVVEAEGALSRLPIESARLPTPGAPLMIGLEGVSVLRRPLAPPARLTPSLPGPLKLLVAIAAPDEGKTRSSVLDSERELGRILTALPSQGAQVRPLEVASLHEITAALKRDDYHVLHLSGHGGATGIELETEDGEPHVATPSDIVAAIDAGARQPLPLVFLSCCDPGTGIDTAPGLAEALITAGLSQVVALRNTVSDAYATALAAAFYDSLASRDDVEPAEALADARRELERHRAANARRGVVTPAEYASATIFCAGLTQSVVGPGVPSPLNIRSSAPAAGAVPMLGVEDLVGRRAEVRRVVWVLSDDPHTVESIGRRAGVVLTGLGGVGKSTIAGRVMSRLADQGWATAVVSGPLMLADLCVAVGQAAAELSGSAARELADRLLQDAPDPVRLAWLSQAMREHPILLVLDNFEDNLEVGGDSLRDDATAGLLGHLLAAAQRGRLLLTSRFPIGPFAGQLHEERVIPLSRAQARKLLLRLPALQDMSAADTATLLRVTGGHPRLIELVDAAMRGNTARLASMAGRLQLHAATLGVDLTQARDDLDAAVTDALDIALRDIALADLVAGLPQQAAHVLGQAAVSNLAVKIDDLTAMVRFDADPVVDQLTRRALISRVSLNSVFVERWTAQGLKEIARIDQWRSRCYVAGAHRMQPAHDGLDVSDVMEAVRNFAEAGDADQALDIAVQVCGFLEASGGTLTLAVFAGEMLVDADLNVGSARMLAQFEANANEALGLSAAAGHRWTLLARSLSALAAAEPDRADYQRDLSVSYDQLGDLMRAVGRGDDAARYFQQALDIATRLAAAEPDRADYQRDLSVSYDRLGDLMRAVGRGDDAARYFQQSLDIRTRLAAAEPDRADYQRDLSISYDRLGDLMRAVGRGDDAARYFQQSLDIRTRLAAAEPDRADYQRDLSVSYNKLGDLMVTAGRGDDAARYFQQALDIATRLAAAEPDRADYQRDLSASYNNLGDLMRAVGRGDDAARYFQQALDIATRLAAAEPDRADYQRDLSVSYNKLGDLMVTAGRGDDAARYFQQALDIATRLAAAEPDRADYQRDLSASYNKLGDLMRAVGRGDDAARYFQQALDIATRLAAAEPDRADYQRDLSISYDQLGDLMRAVGRGDDAARYFQQALDIATRLAAAEPDRADYQRDLSISYDRLGDLMRAVGRGDDAARYFQQALDIATRLAAAEPDRADYQRDLSVSYDRLGDLMRAVGRGDDAARYFQQSLDIATRLAAAEPDRADYQRDLSVSYDRLGDLMRAVGRGDDAARYFQQSLDIRTRLAAAEPDRADYQRDLSISYDQLGDLMRAVGRGDDAARYFQQSLDIATRLAAAEPDRADYQRDLSVSFNKLGDLMRAVGRGDDAARYFQQSLDIRTRLAAAEPDRADYQRDLSVSYDRLGDLMRAVGRGDDAARYFQQSLDIRTRLAAAEPDRADYQRDLSISYDQLGDLMRAVGRGDDAARYFQQSLDIRTRLAAAEPDRADYQRDLSISYERLGDQMEREEDLAAAIQFYEQSLPLAASLAARSPGNPGLQRDVDITLSRLADLSLLIGDEEAAAGYRLRTATKDEETDESHMERGI